MKVFFKGTFFKLGATFGAVFLLFFALDLSAKDRRGLCAKRTLHQRVRELPFWLPCGAFAKCFVAAHNENAQSALRH